MKDHVTVALDTSGEGLYKRGYRAVGVERSPAGDAGGGAGASCPVTRGWIPSAIPSAAAAPSPLRPLSSPKTVPPA